MGKRRKKTQVNTAARKDTPPTALAGKWHESWWWVALAIAVLPFVWSRINTSDAWWHVAIGREIVSKWRVPDFAQFYFTPVTGRVPDLRWQAAGDVILYLCHAIAGDFGLQALSMAAVAIACLLLRRLHKGPMNGWLFTLLALLAVATHQLQLPRNAVFSLALLPLLFWVFHRWETSRDIRWLWSFPPILGLWGVLHGSYLLGLGISGLLLLGALVDLWREKSDHLVKVSVHFVLILSASVALNLVGNPLTSSYISRVLRAPLPAAKAEGKIRSKPRAQKPPAPEVKSLKTWLNNTLWTPSAEQVRSGDFVSPFDRLGYLPVPIAFLLTIAALIWTAVTRTLKVSWLLACTALLFLGVCYLRMIGYAAIGAATLLLLAKPASTAIGLPVRKFAWMMAAFTIAAAIGFYGAWMGGKVGSWLGYTLHIPGPGKSPIFDDAACDWLYANHPEQRVFTTIVTGSYALHRWEARKQVFIDGFFAPHPSTLMKEYTRARQRGELQPLHETYGVVFALIEHTRPDWNRVFIESPEWQPAAIGSGCMIYAHRSLGRMGPPELLCDIEAVKNLQPIFQKGFAYNYGGAVLSLASVRRLSEVRAFISKDPALYSQVQKLLPDPQREAIRQLENVLNSNREPTPVPTENAR